MNLSDSKKIFFSAHVSAARVAENGICSIVVHDTITTKSIITAFGEGKMPHRREVLGLVKFMI